MSSKFIIVVGGVYSGTGKGVCCASLAFLLKQRGLTVVPVKCDPYLNVSASVLSPREHGESFVTEDGHECDLDMGTYERIGEVQVSRDNIFTTGQVYKELIGEHEVGDYIGQTLQIVPHVTQKIQKKWTELGEKADVVVIEIGGTVGDMESAPFYEAIRQFKLKHKDTVVVMVAPILWVPTIKEYKTKPLQNSVRELLRCGIHPDILLCRSTEEAPEKLLDKVADLTSVPRECVFTAPDVSTVYQVPIEFYSRHIDDLLVDLLRLKRTHCRIHKHREIVEKYVQGNLPVVNIGVIAKYVENPNEAYLSLKEALFHAGLANDAKVKIEWIKAEDLEKNKGKISDSIHGIIVPGGFDKRGIEGKINATQNARENKLPFLGICLGLQCAVIEFARNVCRLAGANSVEFDKNSPHPVVHYVLGQENLKKMSDTMRLGSYKCELVKGSLAHSLYKSSLIEERHRHRFEVNHKYTDQMRDHGLIVSGSNPGTNLVEIMELNRDVHPYFIGTQAHPEFKSRLTAAAPLFVGLVRAALERQAQTSK
jgi:CTP synthase